MNTNIRSILAASGAATILATLGAFATTQPASASPADPGSPSTLSGNVVHAPASTDDEGDAASISPADACAAVDCGSFTGDDRVWACWYSYNEDKYDEQVALEGACTGSYMEEVFYSENRVDQVEAMCT